jgi:hypothetical protein
VFDHISTRRSRANAPSSTRDHQLDTRGAGWTVGRAVLRQTALEFQRLHWGRVLFNVAGSWAIFKGFLAYYRYWLMSERWSG